MGAIKSRPCAPHVADTYPPGAIYPLSVVCYDAVDKQFVCFTENKKACALPRQRAQCRGVGVDLLLRRSRFKQLGSSELSTLLNGKLSTRFKPLGRFHGGAEVARTNATPHLLVDPNHVCCIGQLHIYKYVLVWVIGHRGRTNRPRLVISADDGSNNSSGSSSSSRIRNRSGGAGSSRKLNSREHRRGQRPLGSQHFQGEPPPSATITARKHARKHGVPKYTHVVGAQ